jgi:hypothetical protein
MKISGPFRRLVDSAYSVVFPEDYIMKQRGGARTGQKKAGPL